MDLKIETKTKRVLLTEDQKKERQKQYAKAYREKNKDKITENYKRWVKGNPDRVKTYHREYYHNNDDAKKYRNKTYYKKHKDIPETLLDKYNLDIGYIIVLKQAIEKIKDKCPLLNIEDIIKDLEEHVKVPKLLE